MYFNKEHEMIRRAVRDFVKKEIIKCPPSTGMAVGLRCREHLLTFFTPYSLQPTFLCKIHSTATLSGTYYKASSSALTNLKYLISIRPLRSTIALLNLRIRA